MSDPMSAKYLEWIRNEVRTKPKNQWKTAMVQDMLAEIDRLRPGIC